MSAGQARLQRASGPVRFGIIGMGYGLTRCAMIRDTPGAELAAVVDRDPGRAQAAGETHQVDWYTDYEPLLERDDIDVVVVYTPTGTHRELAVEAARRGKHVLVTKPLEINLARCDDMISACRESGVQLFCEYYLRYNPANLRLKAATEAGALGRLILGEFSFKCFRPQWYYDVQGGWRGTWRYNGGGVLMNQTIHIIDMISWLMGPVATVSALTGTHAHEIEVEDCGAALLQMRNGAMAVLTGTTTYHDSGPADPFFGGGSTSWIAVNGDHGNACIRDEELVLWNVPGLAEGEPSAAQPNIFADLVKALRDDAYHSPALATGEQARESVRVVLAMYEASRLGRPVDVAVAPDRPVAATGG